MDQDTSIVWPPNYTVRRSQRARRIFLQIRPVKGLEIVIPHRHNNLDFTALLDEKRGWIEKILLQMTSFNLNSNPTSVLPSNIDLPALSRSWYVQYLSDQNHKSTTVKIQTMSDNVLQIKGAIDDPVLCKKNH